MKFSENGISKALLDAVNEVNEETLDEISRHKVDKYINDAQKSVGDNTVANKMYKATSSNMYQRAKDPDATPTQKQSYKKLGAGAKSWEKFHGNKLRKRSAGLDLAVKKKIGTAKVPTTTN